MGWRAAALSSSTAHGRQQTNFAGGSRGTNTFQASQARHRQHAQLCPVHVYERLPDVREGGDASKGAAPALPRTSRPPGSRGQLAPDRVSASEPRTQMGRLAPALAGPPPLCVLRSLLLQASWEGAARGPSQGAESQFDSMGMLPVLTLHQALVGCWDASLERGRTARRGGRQ